MAGTLHVTVRRGKLRLLRGLCAVVGLVLICVGSAGPQWGRDWEQAASPGRDLVVVLDRSRSMLAEKPSRLERARTALLNLVDSFKLRGSGHRLALIAFAGQAKLVCPLTHDYDHFREVVAAIDPNAMDGDLAATLGGASGTRIGQALQLAVRTHALPGVSDILLLSAGDDPAQDGEWTEGITAARAAGIPVWTVGIGNPDELSPVPGASNGENESAPGRYEYDGQPVQSRLEEEPLRQIARRTGGTYEPARRQTPPLEMLYSQLIASQAMRDGGDDALPVYRQHPGWFLTPALLFLALTMAMGDGASVRRAP
jgi:Ca-activated chloride channel family protein